MRRYDDIGHRDQTRKGIVLKNMSGIVFKEQIGFFLVDVQTCRADLPCLDGGQQCFRIDQRTAGSIDEHNTAFACGKGLFVDNMIGFLGQRTVQGNDIGFCKQLLGRDIAYRIAVVKTFCGKLVIGEDLHAEAKTDVDKDTSDATRADDTDRLAVQVKAGHAI